MKKHKQLNSKVKKSTVNPAYEVYLNSLAIGGRKGMISMLGQACRILGWQSAPAYYPWHELSYQKLHLVRAKMLELEYSINSVNLTLSGLRGIAKTAFNLELMSSEQLMRIQAVNLVKGEVLRKGRSLSDAEINELLRACAERKTHTMAIRDKAILLLGCGAGIRCSELISVRVYDFDSQSGTINILNGKGRRQRTIALAKPVVDALTSWIDVLPSKSGPLFREIRRGGSIRLNGLTKQGVAKVLQGLQEVSGVSKFSPHDMRRTFTTRLLDQGNDFKTVKALCNHASVSTTERYDFRALSEINNASRSIF